MSVGLRRYTDLSSAIYILQNKAVTLINPRSWQDTNDSYYLSLYKKAKDLRTLLALCFTESDERLDYWCIFAPGPSGVCIEFDKSSLLSHALKVHGVTKGVVGYKRLNAIREDPPTIDELPFLKRWGFEHESEFRLIYASKAEKKDSLDINIPLHSITKVTFSPWIHPKVFPVVKTTLRNLPSCNRITMSRSTLIGNEEWKQIGDDAVIRAAARTERANVTLA